MEKKKIKVLIVEDSPSVQLLLEKIITDDPCLELCGIVSNGLEAIEFVRSTPPDVITMDIIMPKMNGLEATRIIMAEKPTPIIIISGKYTKEDVNIGFEAMEAGAVSIMEKPLGIRDPSFSKISASIQKIIRSVSGIKLISRHYRGLKIQNNEVAKISSKINGEIQVIAIGASLGGPQAIKEVLQEFPAKFPLPILIVQHIAQGFGDGFVEWLNKSVSINVISPKGGELLCPNTVFISPDNRHMVVTREKKISLLDTPPVHNLKPSVSVLFSSISEFYGSQALGILLTGMGSDGSKELLSMFNRGAITIAQNEETCIAYGMPGSAVKLGAAKYILPLNEIARFVLTHFKK